MYNSQDMVKNLCSPTDALNKEDVIYMKWSTSLLKNEILPFCKQSGRALESIMLLVK